MKQFLISTFFILLSAVLFADTNGEITIFTLPGCGRCAYILDYLKSNKIRYTEYSTSDTNANKKMWVKIRTSGKYKDGSISMPVMIINNQTYFNIDNLEDFAGSINSLLSGSEFPTGESDNNVEALPSFIYVWTDGSSVINHEADEWTKKKLPIINHYNGTKNSVYIAVYSHNESGSIYPVGGGIYVMGLIRVEGNWNGRIAEPKGWEGKDISASDAFKKLAIMYFPACKKDGWVGGDTGGFFGIE